MTTPELAPEALEPSGPMLASKPAFAIGNSEDMKLSTDWPVQLPRRRARERSVEDHRILKKKLQATIRGTSMVWGFYIVDLPLRIMQEDHAHCISSAMAGTSKTMWNRVLHRR
jgi:hypothetical protein